MSSNKCRVDEFIETELEEYDIPYVVLHNKKFYATHRILSLLSLVQGQKINDKTALKIIQENIKECSTCPAE